MGSDAIVLIGVLLMIAGFLTALKCRPRSAPVRMFTVRYSDGTVRTIYR